MSKDDEPQELAPLESGAMAAVDVGLYDVSDLMWRTSEGQLIPLKMMADSHLRNTALMLMGMGYQTYRATDELKVRWLTALRIEWEKRMAERRSSGKFQHTR